MAIAVADVLAITTVGLVWVGIAVFLGVRFLGQVRRGMTEAETAHRRRDNQCLACVYRLAGNRSGVCPECGTPTGDDRGQRPTERRLAASAGFDAMSVEDALDVMNGQDAVAVTAVRAERDNVAAAVRLVVEAFNGGGRLVYFGAGTSGRLGVLDASECPPTFRSEPGQVQGVIAGGDGAMFRAVEGAEDDAAAGAAAVDDRQLGPADVAVGIAASGTTPFVWGALIQARSRGARTVLLACVPPVAGEPVVDVAIRPISGPEVLTGSTRLKAGTTTKLVLNQLTTVAFAQTGKAYDNLMVDVRATNAKLADRATRMVTALTGLTPADAGEVLRRADGHVKTAVVMHRRGETIEAARARLARCDGSLRAAID